jgi:hypothetical protein
MPVAPRDFTRDVRDIVADVLFDVNTLLGNDTSVYFLTQPSVTPLTGTAGQTTFTATQGTLSDGSTPLAAWLLNGTVLSTSLAFTPTAQQIGQVTYQETSADGVATSNPIAITVNADGGQLPALSITGPLTVTTEAPAGTIVAYGGGMPAGVPLVLNDNRFTLGTLTEDNLYPIEKAAGSLPAGVIALTISAQGATSATANINVTVAGAAVVNFAVDAGKTAQTYMGGYIEIQPDSWNGSTPPAVDGTTETWGFPYSLTAPERARLRDTAFPGDGYGINLIRFPLGFAYRGFRNIDTTTGFARNIGPRFAEQDNRLRDLFANLGAAGGGLMPEYWSPAPHWKTQTAYGPTPSSPTYGNGKLWAGGTYSRTTRLDSIRGSDRTQYNKQIDEWTDAIVNDLEYLHQNVAPVRGFGLQNEAGLSHSATTCIYGQCTYSENEYADTLRSLIPKIRNSAILSTWGGQPNTVLLNFNSWHGPTDTGRGALRDQTVLSTGKTVIQEIWAFTRHWIREIYQNADFIKQNAAAWLREDAGIYIDANGNEARYWPERTVPSFNNEQEYFDLNASAGYRCANTMLWMAHDWNKGAPTLMPIIHIMKQLGANNATSNTEGYGFTQMRLPAADGGQSPSTAGDANPTLNHGEWMPVAANWNAGNLFLRCMPAGSIRVGDVFDLGAGKAHASFRTPNGKYGIIIVNRNNTASSHTVTMPVSGAYSGRRFSINNDGTALTTQTGSQLNITVPANSGECWLLDGFPAAMLPGRGPITVVGTSVTGGQNQISVDSLAPVQALNATGGAGSINVTGA